MRIITLFQFTPLREGRRLTPDEMGELTDYFNSRPSARGDVLVHHNPTKLIISIHAPPRGATRRYCTATKRKSISIHAPPRGATRHPTGRAQRHLISIHAPPRGATPAAWLLPAPIEFQFTPLREGRRACWLAADGANISIHAPPRGATVTPTRSPSCLRISIHAPPRGATVDSLMRTSVGSISIHAPPRGAT